MNSIFSRTYLCRALLKFSVRNKIFTDFILLNTLCVICCYKLPPIIIVHVNKLHKGFQQKNQYEVFKYFICNIDLEFCTYIWITLQFAQYYVYSIIQCIDCRKVFNNHVIFVLLLISHVLRYVGILHGITNTLGTIPGVLAPIAVGQLAKDVSCHYINF